MEKEATKFLAWYEREKRAGLIDVKFFASCTTSDGTSQEAFFAELNEMNDLLEQGHVVEPGEVF